MFRIKICGVTNVEDAIAAVDAGADAIGLNFYKGSPRCVSPKAARDITMPVYARALCIGVFVNAEVSELTSAYSTASLHGIQLHGDESPQTVVQSIEAMMPYSIGATESEEFPLPVMPEWLLDWARKHTLTLLIRARRFDDGGVAAIAADIAACAAAGHRPEAVLVDALSPGRYGGTGETVSWVGLADHRRWLGDTPLILAGGLTPDNVAEAIRIVRPAAVDVASGVESSPGKKDPAKIRDFVAAARAAFEA